MKKRLSLLIVLGILLNPAQGFCGPWDSGSGSSGGSGSGSGITYSSDSAIGGQTAKLLFDPNGNAGVIRIYSEGNIYNNALDLKLNNEYRSALLSGLGNINELGFDKTFSPRKNILIGGVRRLTGQNVTSKIVSFYKLDETSGTSVADSVGSNTGTASSAIDTNFTVPGKIIRGFHFDTADTDEVNLGSGSSLKVGSGDFTVGGWFRVKTSNSSAIMRVCGNRNSTGNTEGWEFYRDISNATTKSGSIVFNVRIGSTSYTTSSSSEFDDGSWHFIVGRRSGSTFSLWFDGVSEGTPSGSSSGNLSTNAGNTYLGGTPQNRARFDGDIDNFFVANDDLTDAEIVALYNSGVGVDGLVTDSATPTNIISTTTSETASHAASYNDLLIAGLLETKGAVYANDYYSGDGTQGYTGSCAIGTALTVKDGLITACA